MNPTVSIVMATYGHEATIEQAIRSIAAQKFDEPIELLVGEDCGPDQSRALILNLRQELGNWIVPCFPESNLGGTRNLENLMNTAKGEFIAFCEGDDFWISPHKLARQVEAMRRNPSASICFTQAIPYRAGTWPQPEPVAMPEIASVQQLLRGNFMHSCSVMYRRQAEFSLPKWFSEIAIGDWPMHVLQALHGPILFLREPMAVYRIHAGGSWSQRSWQYRKNEVIRMLGYLRNELPNQLHPALDETVARLQQAKDETDRFSGLYAEIAA